MTSVTANEGISVMRIRRTLALLSVIIVACASHAANAGNAKMHHYRHAVKYHSPPIEQAPYYGGRLVEHPAFNIACMTRDRATRALPCDQPVWVYGSPCEIDLGLGRYRSCD
jgi:hypothetical protein